MDNMTLAQLQNFAAKHKSADDRLNEGEAQMTDVVSRLVGPTIERLQAGEADMQDIVNRMAGPALERTNAAAKRMGKTVLKLAQNPHARSMEDAAEMTALMARLQSQGFPQSSRGQSVPRQYPPDTQMVQGEPNPSVGTSFALSGAQTMGLPGAPQDTAAIGNRSRLAGSAVTGVPNLAAPPNLVVGTGLPANCYLDQASESIVCGTAGVDTLPVNDAQPPKLPPPPPPPSPPPPPVSTQEPEEPPEGCDLCEALIYAAKKLCHCAERISAQWFACICAGRSSTTVPVQESRQWTEPPEWAPDEAETAPEYETHDDAVGALAGFLADAVKPSGLAAFGAEAGGAIGGETTSFDLPNAR